MSKKKKKKCHLPVRKYIFLLVIALIGLSLLFLPSLCHHTFYSSKNVSPTVAAPAIISSDYLSIKEYQQTDKTLTNIVEEKDPRAALQQLTNLMNIDPKIYNSCHGLAHDIGHAAYKKYHDLVQAFGYQDDVCGSGYIHGVIEQYFGNTKDITTALYSICTEYAGQIGEGNCYHGVGHGIMFYTGNNLPQSTYFCDMYKDTLARSRCSEGVFMENFNSAIRFHPSNYLKPTNPMYPCPEQPDFHKSACYFYAPDYYLTIHPHDYAGAVNWCQTAEPGYILTCINGVGSRTMKQNIGSPKFAESICMQAKTQQQINTCIDGMVSYYLVQYNSQQKARDMCSHLQAMHQSACYSGVRQRDASFAE